jgi:hypothetical protein
MVKGTDTDKQSSLLHYGIDYGRKKFYDTDAIFITLTRSKNLERENLIFCHKKTESESTGTSY